MSLRPEIMPRSRRRVALTHSDLFARYLRWDAANPHFYPLFERFALELAQRGHRHLGVRVVWERIRWESMVSTVGDRYKLNDHYHALYARRFMNDHPEYTGLFRTRLQHALWTWGASLLRSPRPQSAAQQPSDQ